MLVKGTISNNQSGETLPGATAFISDASGKMINPPRGINADADGKYSINANIGEYLTATFVGLQNKTLPITSDTVDFPLQIGSNATLGPVEIITKEFNWKLAIALTLVAGGMIYFSLDFLKYKKIIFA